VDIDAQHRTLVSNQQELVTCSRVLSSTFQMYGGEDGTRYFTLAVGSADSDYYSALVVLPITVAREKAPVNGAFFSARGCDCSARWIQPPQRSNKRIHTITARVTAVTAARRVQLIRWPNHHNSAQHIRTGPSISRFIALPRQRNDPFSVDGPCCRPHRR
jgi:hypothetical protein